jgi:LAS superfamily LD-carboxypeptidase LdcB
MFELVMGPAVRRRTLLRTVALLAAAVPALRIGPAAAQSTISVGQLRGLAELGIERLGDEVTSVFGLYPPEADETLANVTRELALSATYRPRDLVSAAAVGIPQSGGQFIRAVTVEDTRALVQAAAAAGHRLSLLSAYRSYAYQVDVFASQVIRRNGDEDGANRFSAKPGHSQHQLGTTHDFQSTGTTFGTFARSDAGVWFWEHAHEYGYVFPYTEASAERTGYVPEAWHARWVGTPLSTFMWALGYRTAAGFNADDVVAAVREAAGFA